MITSYTYKITATNPEMGAMEVEFSSPGLPTVLVGARMPYTDEDLDMVVRSFAPIGHWETVGKSVAEVVVGHEAAVDLTVAPAPVDPQPTVQEFTPGQTSLTSVKTTPLQFMSLFTQEEQLAITAASLQSPEVRLWYDQLIASTEVVNTDPRIAAGLDALVAAGLLTQVRRDVILPPTSGVTPV